MEFRRLVLKDLDACYSNRLRGLASDPTAFLVTIEEEKERGSEHFKETLSHRGDDRLIFGAVDGSVVVGTLGIFVENGRLKTAHKAVIWGMHVDKDYRGQSVASRLLDMAIEHARNKMKVKVIYLTVEGANANARAFYESRGFVRWGNEPMAMLNGDVFSSEDHMSLIL